MVKDASTDDGEDSMYKKIQFFIHFGGEWVRDKIWRFESWNMHVIEDEMSNITLGRIVKEISELGFMSPKKTYVIDPEKSFEDGLYLIVDENRCKKVLQYLKVLGYETVDIYVDSDYCPMPNFIPSLLITEKVNCDNDISMEGTRHGSRAGKQCERWLDERMLEGQNEILEEENDSDEELESEGDGEDEHDFNNIDIPTQCSRLNIKEITYVHPVGYVSEEENDEREGGQEENEDSEGDDEQSMDISTEDTYSQASQLYFKLGMTFANAQEARDAINEYSVKNGYKLKFVKNEKTRIRMHCVNAEGCPFMLYTSKDGDLGGMVVKTFCTEHICFKQREVPSASKAYIAKYFKDALYKNPKFKVKDMQAEIEKYLKIHVSEDKCKRAKMIILHDLEGSFKHEFSILGAYAEKLKESNPRTLCEIELDKEPAENGNKRFKMIFVMLEACRRNWLEGCRPLISLDGCFLKGIVTGMVLTAVGRDGNDNIVPIAWAVVNKENTANWRWFLCWLTQELKLGDGSKYTIISDMQKGLINADKMTLPKVEHRQCARHVHANWSKKWHGDELKKRFWICAWSTFDEEFKANLEKLGKINKKAAEEQLRFPYHTWCRAYQSSRCSSYQVDSNISESFNSVIVGARHKPIMSMLEDIRIIAMGRIRDRRNLCDSWICEWSPAAMTIFEENKKDAIGCKVVWNGASGYEIGEGEDKHTVLLDNGICTCRRWELTGIPCMHAISAMYHSKLDPMKFIAHWYDKPTYRKAYQHTIAHVPGIKFFNIEAHAPIEPPKNEKMPGRPRKKRVRATNEPNPSGNKLSRKNQVQKCSICKVSGHNKFSCELNGNKTTRPPKLAAKRHYKASKPIAGYERHVDLRTGRTTLNPGLSSEVVISVPHQSDPEKRGAIPNERELRAERSSLRAINFTGEGEVRRSSSLPFKPPGLQWKGNPSLTTRQLLEQRYKRQTRQKEPTGSTSTTSNIED